MKTVSPQFLESVRHSHMVAATCELVFPGNPEPVEVPVEAGSVTIDRTAQSRRAGQVTIPWSADIAAELGIDIRTLPLGGYALLRRGIRYPDGSTELVLLGRLRVESVTWGTLDTTADLELADRMAQVRDEPFPAPFACKGKTPANAAIDIVKGVFGLTIAYWAPFTPSATMGDVFYTDDRAEALTAIEQSYGAETYFDADGNFVFAQAPTGLEPVVWTVDAADGGVMIDADENLDRTGIYNGVLVRGQQTGDAPPVSAIAYYTAPTSPIRWAGPFGKVLLVADAEVTTYAQALATAQSLLKLRLKQTRSLALTAAPNPALEAGDTIKVVFPDKRQETHLIDAVTIDLATAAQQIVTRTQADPGATVTR